MQGRIAGYPACFMNELVTLARMQFGVTSVYHFLFVPLTLGLSVLVAIMETLYVRRDNEIYKDMTRFWGRLFLINFALGVVTGIVQEFHFGMAWGGFSRFIGDVLGAPLAIEALAAFFAESTFLGIWIFGWDRISKKLHLACIWVVAAAGAMSAFWILVVNTFMQDPSGYVLENGRARMTDFFSLISSQHLWLQFPHTLMSGFVTGSIFVLGISAYHLLKRSHSEFFMKSVKLAMILGIVSLVLIIFFGDAHGKYLFKAQPMKMAAAEALWESKDPAPLSILSIIDEKEHKNTLEVTIPRMLSFLAYSKFSGKVEGINDIQKRYEAELGPGNYVPPVLVAYLSFRLMVGAGIVMLLAVLLTIFLYWRRRLENSKWFLRFLLVLIPVPYVSNTLGWVLTETGRQPWVVYKVLKVDDAVSKSVPPGVLLFSLVGFVLMYGILAAVDLFLIAKYARLGPEKAAAGKAKKPEGGEASLWV
jgi:cytochrome bd ubiquinol oxidase subunit I